MLLGEPLETSLRPFPALYAAACWWTLGQGHRLDGRFGLVAILGAAVLARVMLLPMTPISTDAYRYVWDGRVQAAGIGPYRHVPADPALAPLRGQAIFPHINRSESAVTIYPPAAQLVFWAITRIAETVTAMKLAMVLFEGLVVVWALLRLLAARGLPRSRVLLYAWHPLPLFEFAGSGHIDAAEIALLMTAMLAADRRRPFLAGALLAAGTGVKYVPAVAGPALYGPWDWRMPVGFLTALVLLYLPYLGAGTGVLGFLPGYVQEEGIGQSGIFWLALASTVVALPGWAAPSYLAAAALLFAGAGLAVALRRHPERISVGAALGLLAAFTLALTPHYPWYFTWLVPFICLRPSAALVWLTAAAPLIYGLLWPSDRFSAEILLYVPFLLILCVEAFRLNASARPKEIGDASRLGQPAG